MVQAVSEIFLYKHLDRQTDIYNCDFISHLFGFVLGMLKLGK